MTTPAPSDDATLEDVRLKLRDTIIADALHTDPWHARLPEFVRAYVDLGGNLEHPQPDPQPRALEAELRVAALEDRIRDLADAWRNLDQAYIAALEIGDVWQPLAAAIRGLLDEA